MVGFRVQAQLSGGLAQRIGVGLLLADMQVCERPARFGESLEVARDRSTGKTLTQVLTSRTAKNIGKALVPALAMDVVLCSDNASAYRTLAKAMDIELRCVPTNPKKRLKGVVYHIQNVNAYDSRLKGWMFRFRGVATKNLPHYLGWHRYLDVPATKPTPRKFLTGALGD